MDNSKAEELLDFTMKKLESVLAQKRALEELVDHVVIKLNQLPYKSDDINQLISYIKEHKLKTEGFYFFEHLIWLIVKRLQVSTSSTTEEKDTSSASSFSEDFNLYNSSSNMSESSESSDDDDATYHKLIGEFPVGLYVWKLGR